MSNFNHFSEKIKNENFIEESKLAESLCGKNNKLCLSQCKIALKSAVKWVYKKEGIKIIDNLEMLIKNDDFMIILGPKLWNRLLKIIDIDANSIKYEEDEYCLKALSTLFYFIQWIDRRYGNPSIQHIFSNKFVPGYNLSITKNFTFVEEQGKNVSSKGYRKDIYNVGKNQNRNNKLMKVMRKIGVAAVVLLLGLAYFIYDGLGNEEQLNISEELYNNGVRYYYGRGVERSYAEAFKNFKKASEQGHNWAQYNLAWCYYNGLGVEQSYNEAIRWYLRSAEQGNALAENNLGDCYYYGKGVEQSYFDAVKWYRKAAVKDYPTAQFNLGWCYYNGQGVDISFEEAVKWYSKSAEAGNISAQNNLGLCYEHGHGIAQSYNRAFKWYYKAAEQGYARAQNNLGNMYLYGRGIKQSTADAIQWYRKAAEQGNVEAQNKIALLNI